MRHTPILERQVRDMLQFSLFWSYYKTRLQHKEGTLPEFKVDFSTIGPEKPSTDEKDFYQCFIHFSPEEAPNKDYFSRMALENQLMDKLSSWKVTHTNKPLMDVTITKATGEFIYEIVNIDLHFQCMKKAARYYTMNQALMDMIANKLILAWDTYSTNFVIHITLHNYCHWLVFKWSIKNHAMIKV